MNIEKLSKKFAKIQNILLPINIHTKKYTYKACISRNFRAELSTMELIQVMKTRPFINVQTLEAEANRN